jgi:transcriptional regulator with XRE-family HTH domain
LKICLGTTARNLRESLGLTQRAAADVLGVSCVHLCNIENDKALPSPALLERYRELWGVDLYVLAWCLHGDASKLPTSMRKAAEKLADGWRRQVKAMVANRRKAASV